MTKQDTQQTLQAARAIDTGITTDERNRPKKESTLSRVGRTVTDFVSEHPAPTFFLLGAGITGLYMSLHPRKVKRLKNTLGENAKEAAHRSRDALDEAREHARSFLQNTQDLASQTSAETREILSEALVGLKDLAEQTFPGNQEPTSSARPE